MESSEPREPSYYEVALTNRQVLVAFVVLLTCMLAAFLSGVWVGRGAAPARAARAVPAPAANPAAPPIEQLTFFADKEPGKGGGAKSGTTPAPAPAAKPVPAAPADSAAEDMRRTLEAEMAAHREGAATAPAAGPPPVAPVAPAPKSVPASAVPLTPGARTMQKPAATPAAPATTAPAPSAAATATAAGPAPATAPAAGTIWIQVYSSSNAERARQIAASLKKARYPVTLAEIPKNGQSTWRVRVGPYATRARADAAATKLRREQRLDTWVTDTP